MKIPFIDLQKQYQAYKTEIDKEIAEVLDSSAYIGGPKVALLEEDDNDWGSVVQRVVRIGDTLYTVSYIKSRSFDLKTEEELGKIFFGNSDDIIEPLYLK